MATYLSFRFGAGESSTTQHHSLAHIPDTQPTHTTFATNPNKSVSATKQPYGSGDQDDGYTLIFADIAAFQAWRESEEEQNMVEFVKGDTHGSKAVPPRFKDHTKLVCARHSRSGRKKYVKKHPERVRKVPSRKLEGQGCPASISYKTYYDTEEVRACYVSQHSHEIGLANLPYTRRGRKAAVEKEKEKRVSVKNTAASPASSSASQSVAGPASVPPETPTPHLASPQPLSPPTPQHTMHQPQPQTQQQHPQQTQQQHMHHHMQQQQVQTVVQQVQQQPQQQPQPQPRQAMASPNPNQQMSSLSSAVTMLSPLSSQQQVQQAQQVQAQQVQVQQVQVQQVQQVQQFQQVQAQQIPQVQQVQQAYSTQQQQTYAQYAMPPYNPMPTPQASMANDRWENMSIMFNSIRDHARTFDYPPSSVAALETVLIRLILESPMGVTAPANMGALMTQAMLARGSTVQQQGMAVGAPNDGSMQTDRNS
ncbi:hypothetical protein BKA70DRAFT_318047 [Coprinopsis sp. MPI-PUGE-AT-0042]|nr:hypothetical protein BKA70DRAFT_318047 [Coprinopsis sp. MPI-PUGE-AT-0042]